MVIGGITGVSMIISMIIVVIISGIIEKIIGRTIQSLKPLFLLIILCYPFISVIFGRDTNLAILVNYLRNRWDSLLESKNP